MVLSGIYKRKQGKCGTLMQAVVFSTAFLSPVSLFNSFFTGALCRFTGVISSDRHSVSNSTIGERLISASAAECNFIFIRKVWVQD